MPAPSYQRYQQEVTQRLWTAQQRTAQSFDRVAIQPDLYQGTEIANKWMYFAAAYSGIEQVYKFLIANHKGMSVADWREQAKGKHDHHDIHTLFGKLPEVDRNILSEHYACFRSLHNYIEPDSLDMFLEVISGGRGNSGSVRWRYALVEPEGLPRNSADAMMAVWEAGTQRVRLRQSLHRPFLMPNDVLSRVLAKLEVQAVGADTDRISFKVWSSEASVSIDQWALLLWRAARGIPPTDHDETGSRWHERLLCAARARRSLSHFVVRAVGCTSGGRSIQWSSVSRRFEDLPWETDLVRQVEKPCNGQHVGANDMWAAWRYILGIAYRGGFATEERVLEQTDDEVWQRTLCATKREANGNIKMEIWQRAYEPDMYVVVDGDDCQAVAELRGLVGDWSDCEVV